MCPHGVLPYGMQRPLPRRRPTRRVDFVVVIRKKNNQTATCVISIEKVICGVSQLTAGNYVQWELATFKVSDRAGSF